MACGREHRRAAGVSRRVPPQQGRRPSWAQVMRGIDLLNRHGVEWNALAVVNDFNGDYPLDFYHFLRI